MTKTCSKCGVEKPVSEYTGQRRGKYGVRSVCKACVSIRNAADRLRRREVPSIGRFGRQKGFHRCANCKTHFSAPDTRTRYCPECLALTTACECGCGALIPQFHPMLPMRRRFVPGHDKPLATCRACGAQWRKTLRDREWVICPACQDATAVCVCGCGATMPAYRTRTGEARRYATAKCATTPEKRAILLRAVKALHADPARKAALLAKQRFPWGKLEEKIASGHRTSLEAKVEAALQALGIRYVFEWPISRLSIDFYLPDHNTAVECDSTYWHTRIGGIIARDKKKKQLLEERGIRLIRLKEDVIHSPTLTETIRQNLTAT